ncbi:MAG: helix-turn-helix domain-containing protein [Caldilinea sp. CFX5]|nr:helix-turn-helix domain-containing protein [Caldilinea sp. CFX5]
MLDLTQEELADRVGCSRATIHKIETEIKHLLALPLHGSYHPLLLARRIDHDRLGIMERLQRAQLR